MPVQIPPPPPSPRGLRRRPEPPSSADTAFPLNLSSDGAPTETLDDHELRLSQPFTQSAAEAPTAAIPVAPNAGELRLPGFESLREVGRGGMGVVFQARQPALNRLVAVKMVLAGQFAKPDDHVRFRLEAEIAARLKHPNVVQVHEVGSVDGRPFLVMEWVEGGTLGEWLKKNRLTPKEAAELIAVLADAVHAAHCQGVIHRDLKPANILLNSPESSVLSPEQKRPSLRTEDSGLRTLSPKIADFGLARLMEREEGLTRSGAALGTPEYMAPEQAAGKKSLIGPAADVYGLGVILYELLAGQPPFRGGTPMETLLLVTQADPQPLARFRAGVPADLETICLKALRKAPCERYASAAELAADLRRWLRHEPIAARPVGAGERLAKWTRRNPLPATLLGLLFLFFVGGFAAVTWLWRQSEQRGDALQNTQAKLLQEQANLTQANAEKEKQTQTAVKNGRASKQMLDFLIKDLLEQAQPEKGQEADLKFVTVLDIAVARLDKAFADSPDLEGTMRMRLGETYFRMGLYDRADAELRKGLKLLAEQLGREDGRTQHCVSALAVVLMAKNKLDEAEKLLDENVSVVHRTQGEDTKPGIHALHNLGLLHYHRRQHAKAEKLFRKALDLAVEQFGLETEEAACELNALGACLSDQGDPAEAVKLQSKALAIRRKVLKPDHPEIVLTLNNLALNHARCGALDQALPIIEEVFSITRRVNGPMHPDTIVVMNSWANILFDLERYPEAEKLLRSVITIGEERFGADHINVWKFNITLGSTLVEQGKLPEAAALHEQALTWGLAKLGDKDKWVRELHVKLADNYTRQGKHEEALRRLRALAELFAKDADPKPELVAHYRLGVLPSLLRLRRLEEARQALAAARGVIPESRADQRALADAYSAYAAALDGKDAEAEPALKQAWGLLMGKAPGGNIAYALQLARLMAELKEQRGAEAEATKWRGLVAELEKKTRIRPTKKLPAIASP